MPDEEIDKIIRDAASQHHPPYDDKAWGKMEILLDKHLPQKKDRKKPVIFLLFFLLLGTALFFAAKNYSTKSNAGIAEDKSNDNPAAAQKNIAATGSNNDATIIKTDQNPGRQFTEQQPVATNTNPSVKTLPASNVRSSTNNNSEAFVGHSKKRNTQKGRFAIKVKKPVATSDNIASINDAKPEKPGTAVINNPESPAITEATNDVGTNDIAGKEQKITTIKTTDSLAVTKATVPAQKAKADSNITNTTSVTASKKIAKTFASNVALTVSAGADLSFIDINNPGKLKPVYGAGLSYALGKHFTVSSGLYVSKKIYTAQPNQYKFTGYVNPHLTGIDANCKVYEIPLTVYYNFAQAKKHSWVAGAGLSSFLMKSETYDYQYKTSAGQSYNYVRTVTNENKHYFSVLTLSGGYQYKFNSRIALTAEPYIKLPLGGVGLGKVKLNSTGLLLTASVKPFNKRK